MSIGNLSCLFMSTLISKFFAVSMIHLSALFLLANLPLRHEGGNKLRAFDFAVGGLLIPLLLQSALLVFHKVYSRDRYFPRLLHKAIDLLPFRLLIIKRSCLLGERRTFLPNLLLWITVHLTEGLLYLLWFSWSFDSQKHWQVFISWMALCLVQGLSLHRLCCIHFGLPPLGRLEEGLPPTPHVTLHFCNLLWASVLSCPSWAGPLTFDLSPFHLRAVCGHGPDDWRQCFHFPAYITG